MEKAYSISITDPKGLHNRPIGRLVDIGQSLSVFGVILRIEDPKGNTADFRSITTIMENIFVSRGECLRVILSGPEDKIKDVDERSIRGANEPFTHYLTEALNDFAGKNSPSAY
ncbi:MAG: HPr family phosphocarrier protein [Candidatus Peribacteraceae bacterium]|nr:HPr family phosphocarrier protein [Candidatus Peribacteraceae bacterium]